MRLSAKFLLSIFLTIGITTVVDAQLLDRVLRKTKQKVGKKVEDMVVEKASEYIAQRVYRSMSDGFDKMLADAYKQDSSYRANYGDSIAIKYGALSKNWMERMNEAADVPDAYTFDVTVIALTTHKKSEDEMTMFFPKDGSYFAMEQVDKGETNIFLLDVERDVTILYRDDGKEKTAQAIPNMMGLASTMAANTPTESLEWKIKEIKSKKILGYECKGFTGESEEASTTAYITDDVDFSWTEAFVNSMKKFVVALNGDDQGMPYQGMVLESSYKSKTKAKEFHTWEVTSIENKSFSLVSSDYTFGGLTEE